jgi:hypothetical protein
MRALLSIALFVVGGVIGGAYLGWSTQQSTTPPSRFQALQTIPEPPVGVELRNALEHRDSSTLAVLLTSQQQDQLMSALGPVAAISEVRLLGAVQTGSETVIGYLIKGQDSQGAETVAGLVLNLKDNVLESLQ